MYREENQVSCAFCTCLIEPSSPLRLYRVLLIRDHLFHSFVHCLRHQRRCVRSLFARDASTFLRAGPHTHIDRRRAQDACYHNTPYLSGEYCVLQPQHHLTTSTSSSRYLDINVGCKGNEKLDTTTCTTTPETSKRTTLLSR